jgi:hypothetical protein
VNTQGKPWLVARQTIQSIIVDRESAVPPLELEMARELRADRQQSRELTLTIDGISAVLDEDGIAALRDFLDTQL